MYQGLTFGIMLVVAVGTALYYFVQGTETPRTNSSNSGGRRSGNQRTRMPAESVAATEPTNFKREPQRRRRKLSKDSRDTCAICLDDLMSNVTIRVLTCGHEFHNKCVNKWLVSSNAVCPLCREAVGE